MSPTLAIIFVTTFGGIGKILYGDMNIALVIAIALAVSTITFIINKFLAKPSEGPQGICDSSILSVHPLCERFSRTVMENYL